MVPDLAYPAYTIVGTQFLLFISSVVCGISLHGWNRLRQKLYYLNWGNSKKVSGMPEKSEVSLACMACPFISCKAESDVAFGHKGYAFVEE
jgi:hypothetical protein